MTEKKETGEKKPEESGQKPTPRKNQPPNVNCLLATMNATKRKRKEDEGS